MRSASVVLLVEAVPGPVWGYLQKSDSLGVKMGSRCLPSVTSCAKVDPALNVVSPQSCDVTDSTKRP
jgi:hypothetical protein